MEIFIRRMREDGFYARILACIGYAEAESGEVQW